MHSRMSPLLSCYALRRQALQLERCSLSVSLRWTSTSNQPLALTLCITRHLPGRAFATSRKQPSPSRSRPPPRVPVRAPPPAAAQSAVPPPPTYPTVSLFSSSASSPGSTRLLYSSDVVNYARGVPWLFVVVLLPAVLYGGYVFVEQDEMMQRPLTAETLPLLLAMTAVPLAFLVFVAASFRFNRRLVRSIHLLPDRRLLITTVNNSWLPPRPASHPLDALLPCFAWTGAPDKMLEKLRFVREDAAGVDWYWLHVKPNRAEDAEAELLDRILSSNRLSTRELLQQHPHL